MPPPFARGRRHSGVARAVVLHSRRLAVSLEYSGCRSRSGTLGEGGFLMAEKAKDHPKQRLRSESLKCEQAVYDAGLPRWLSEHEGKHVLIKGDVVAGFFLSRDEALTAGYAQFGFGPLFVKLLLPAEPVYHIPNALV